MILTTVLQIIILLSLILFAGFPAMVEFSIVSSRRNRLEYLADARRVGSTIAIELANKPSEFLPTIKLLQPKSPPPGVFLTVAGFALLQLNHLPQPGERFVRGDCDFQIAEMNGRRIGCLFVQPHR